MRSCVVMPTPNAILARYTWGSRIPNVEKNSRIFVAGQRGLAGSAIVRRLREQGYENLVVRARAELDLRNQAAVDSFFTEAEPEYVFLAAAKVGGIMANSSHPAEFLHDNL